MIATVPDFRRLATFSQHERPISHRRRLHGPPVRWQSAGRLSRCARNCLRPYATDRARVQLLGDDFRAAADRPEPYCEGAHLHAWWRVAVRRTSDDRHRARAGDHWCDSTDRTRDAHRVRGRRWSCARHDSVRERQTRVRDAVRREAARGRTAAAVARDARRDAFIDHGRRARAATWRRKPSRVERRSCSSRCAIAPPSRARACARDLWESTLARLHHRQGDGLRDGRRAPDVGRSRSNVCAGHRRPGRSRDRKRRGRTRRLSRGTRSAVRRNAALGRRAGLRDGPAEHSRGRGGQARWSHHGGARRWKDGDGLRRDDDALCERLSVSTFHRSDRIQSTRR